ncbi:MAG: hypothetical protein QXX35_04180 [Desulfurococcaceae archaeon]
MVNIFIKTPSRLHLGFYNFNRENIAYGGIGLAIDNPNIELIISKNNRLEIVNETNIELNDVVEKIVNTLEISGFKLIVKSAIPRHIGLGSTTQLLLAISYGLSKLYGLKYSVRELAVKLGRGYVSGIGISVFEKGGLIIDSGRRLDNNILREVETIHDLPLPIARYSLPRKWFFILITPRVSKRISDEFEKQFLEKPLKIDDNLQCKLYATLLLELIPSVIRRDIVGFGKALSKIQYITGEYFSKYQYGLFCCRESEEAVNIMLSKGVYGVGQSSWGPTVYGLVDNYSRALKILRETLNELERRGIDVEYSFISRPLNRGFRVKYF